MIPTPLTSSDIGGTTLQCFRRHRCPAAVAADSVARPVRTTTVGYPAGIFARRLGKVGDISLKRHGVSPQKKDRNVCWLLNLAKTALLCYDNTLCNKKHVDARFFFFSGMFLAIWPSLILPSEHSQKNPWFFQAPNAMRRSRKRRSMGWASKALVGYCCLYPGQPPGASKLSRHFGGLFPITNELLSANKQQTKTQALVANDESLEAKEGVQYNGSHPTTSKVYTDLRGSEWLLPLKASFVDAIQMKLDFQDFGDISKDAVVLCVPGVAWLIFEMIWVWSHLRTVFFSPLRTQLGCAHSACVLPKTR